MTIPLLSTYPGENVVQKDTCTSMFIDKLFATIKTWKEPKCPGTDEWMQKMCYVYTGGEKMYTAEDFTWITPKTIAQSYKNARIRAGLTQRGLAYQIGVKPKQISRWENARCRPTYTNYLKLKEALNL